MQLVMHPMLAQGKSLTNKSLHLLSSFSLSSHYYCTVIYLTLQVKQELYEIQLFQGTTFLAFVSKPVTTRQYRITNKTFEPKKY